MAKVIKAILVLCLCLLMAPDTHAFSLLGPFTPWQTRDLAYNLRNTDIGGPMNTGEGFRWNIPVITYAFDRSFINYFGPEGVKAIDEAMRILNEVPPASKITDLSEYSTATQRENFEAETLSLFDLKTTALHLIVEELGLADPVRYTYTLRGRAVGGGPPPSTNYVIAFRNYDPVTLQSSRYVNDTLYTFEIQEFAQPVQHADAVEFPVTPEALEFVPVATGGARVGIPGPNSSVAVGRFRVGLSRDDIGGLRYLYHKNNFAVEDLLPTITLGRRLDTAWQPYLNITNFVGVTNQFIGTNALGTNVVSTGTRGGKNKLRFQKVFFDSIVGTSFTPITNAYTDVTVATNNVLIVQPVLRAIALPDIIFTAEDLGLTTPPAISTLLTRRTDTSAWIDNDALNGFDEVGPEALGPGVIPPTVIISFSDQLPALSSSDNAFLSGEDFSFITGYWGSFDGSTNPPIIFSRTGLLNIQQLRNQVLGGAPR